MMAGKGKAGVPRQVISGPRCVLGFDDPRFPDALRKIPRPPKKLYVLGNPDALLTPSLAVVGARKATPYGLGCAKRFSALAAARGICIVSGGARGCDSAAHEAALAAGAPTVAFLGGGADMPYPAENVALFERIALSGGAVVSEHEWSAPPLPQRFRTRNRLIAGLATATLIVEAGVPSGTFSTADEALSAGKDVLVVPGAITSPHSAGANRLLYQGASPVVDDESFGDALFQLYGCLKQEACEDGGIAPSALEGVAGKSYAKRDCVVATAAEGRAAASVPLAESTGDAVYDALSAGPLGMEELFAVARKHCGQFEPRAWLMQRLVAGEAAGLFARWPDGRWGPLVR